jgi:protein TonB
MIGSTERQRLFICWSISILFHAGLLTFGVALLIKQASFQVEAGKTSTAIDLVVESMPIPSPTPPAPTLPVRPPLPPVQPAPVAEPIKPQVTTTPEPVFTAPPASVVAPAKPRPAKAPAKPKASTAQETNSAAKGALQAQPDELHNEPPEYPEESRIAREQGVVILQVAVTAAGEPAGVSIVKSSGFFRLDQAARRAVQHWKFHPAMTAGIPVSSEADVPVHFKLQ